MKRVAVLLIAVLTCASGASAIAAAHSAPRADAARAAKVTLRHTALGTLLVSSSGRTLYEFTRDHGRQNSCLKISECSATWPAYETTGRPLAGAGVQASKLSSINLPGGAKQVTYMGHALYLYSADEGPGETSYVGAREFGGSWYALTGAGRSVR